MRARPATHRSRTARRLGLAAAPALLLFTVLGFAHDDAKQAEQGEPVEGPGIRGQVMLPDAAGRIGEFDASDVALLSWMTSLDLSGRTQPANDVWGYATKRGREFAIVGLFTGTAFVDVTDPVEPVPVGVVEGSVSTWRDMAVYRKVAYSVNETGDGLQVIDMRRIHKGRVRLRREVAARGLATAHNVSVNEASGTLYLSGSNLGRGGLYAVDVRRPLLPKLVGPVWDDAYVHDALVVTYDEGPWAGREIAFAFAGERGLVIVDVTDKTRPVQLSELAYPGLAYSHSGWLHGKRRFLYLNDELDERGGVPRTTTYVVDVSDLERPRFVRAASNGQTSIDHNSMVRGKRLYAANYTSGLRVFNLRRPARPREVAFFDTQPDTAEPLFSGAWGVYAGLPSGVVLVSDIERGLFVLY